MNHAILIQLASVIGVLLGGGVGVSVVAQLVKKLFGLNSKHVIHFMVMALAFSAAGFQYIVSLKGLPLQVLGVSTPAIYGFSQAAYIFVEKASNFLSRVNTSVDPTSVDTTTTIITPTATPTATTGTGAEANF